MKKTIDSVLKNPKTTLFGVMILGIIAYSVYKGHELNVEVMMALVTALGLMVSSDGDKSTGGQGGDQA